jgi:hypothetical protein
LHFSAPTSCHPDEDINTYQLRSLLPTKW